MLVMLGGVPGAGKTTLIEALRSECPDLHAIDPETVRRRLASLLPPGFPYPVYRPVVHILNAALALVALGAGPRAGGGPLVLHDPATRARRREFLGYLARLCGWVPVLVLLDVSREEALAGQRLRGRVVPAASFERHWARWTGQRPGLTDRIRPSAAWPWSRVIVVGRVGAPDALGRAIGHESESL